MRTGSLGAPLRRCERARRPGHGAQRSGQPSKVSGVSPGRRPSRPWNTFRHHPPIASSTDRCTHLRRAEPFGHPRDVRGARRVGVLHRDIARTDGTRMLSGAEVSPAAGILPSGRSSLTCCSRVRGPGRYARRGLARNESRRVAILIGTCTALVSRSCRAHPRSADRCR